MPIRTQSDLPAKEILERENIFVMEEGRASHQDIRPIQIAILNLMPLKEDTELQLLRSLSNTPLQVDVTFVRVSSHEAKNTSTSHLNKFYVTFDEIKIHHYDGLIITGAPVELMEFEEVDYWDELCMIMDWAKKNVYSTMFICWGSQAAMYHYYGIKKHLLDKKLCGVFSHEILLPSHPLIRGFDDCYFAPHSRYTGVDIQEVEAVSDLDIIGVSKEAGVHIAASRDCRRFFISGHSEYDRGTLAGEYERDLKKGLNPELPLHYFPDNDPDRLPLMNWRAHANLLFSNWLNYFVYQRTPYDLEDLE